MKWISVKDSLPINCTLCAYRTNWPSPVIGCGEYYANEKEFDEPIDYGTIALSEVTHWMPLPEPPEKE